MPGLRFLLVFWGFVLLACVPLRATPQRFEYRQLHMGVEARLVFYAADSARALTAARAAFDRIAELDAIMSDYRDDSELMRLVAEPVGTWVSVSDPLWRVLLFAQQLARESNGAFDVTAGPVVRQWREARRTGELPGPRELAEARSRTGSRLLELDPDRKAVRLHRPGMRLDLGGIAKGFAADEALETLRRQGIDHALIEMGGDIVVGDPPPGQNGWRIRIADAAGAPPLIELANAAISTSGDAVQFVEIDGVRYSHVVDPRTGMALRDRTAATVIAPDGLRSDPLSTLAGVLGEEEGSAFLRRHYPETTFYIRQL